MKILMNWTIEKQELLSLQLRYERKLSTFMRYQFMINLGSRFVQLVE